MTVSIPLTWDELAVADPDGYTMAMVPDLVHGRYDPWAGIDDVDLVDCSAVRVWSPPT
ncbi:hypothetical protein [Mycobacterium leprae]|uniref:hypothetical protein n=1 Tax=Mycobacterium leprae TaxID=1769 RepID=UPI0002D2C399|nr:hypothetical protein [Mycobacterium leprae]